MRSITLYLAKVVNYILLMAFAAAVETLLVYSTPALADTMTKVSNEPAIIFKDVVYQKTPQRALHLDLYLNETSQTQKTPVLVHFHGGGWMRGARPKSWGNFRPFLQAGFSVATVEYRLGGEAPAPAAVQDARCAVKWLADHGDQYGIDKHKIIVMGTSSGAHLALMAGLLAEDNSVDLEHCMGAPQVAAIVDFYGPVDLTVKHPITGKRPSTFVNWTGQGETGEEMAKMMSPLTLVNENSPPVFIAHGDSDPVMPYSQSQKLKTKLDNHKVPNHMVTIKGGRHGKFSKTEQARTHQELLEFLEEIGLMTSN